jgi:hypothetical protein
MDYDKIKIKGINMSYYTPLSTNPSLRKLYRGAKKIAQDSKKGDKIMCPCGCLNLFKKTSDSHIFMKSEKDVCKTRYYTKTNSKRSFDLTKEMMTIHIGMNKYIKEYKKNNPEKENKSKKTEEVNYVNDEATSENYINVLKEVKKSSKNNKKGSRVMCPCGCLKTFIKNTEHHTFSRDAKDECKDKFYTIVRSENKIEMTPEKILSFKVMRNYVLDNIKEFNKIKKINNNKLLKK